MIKKIIIYGSQYGTTKRYAKEFGKRTQIEVKSYDEIHDINTYETIVYFGALYAGGVLVNIPSEWCGENAPRGAQRPLKWCIHPA